jgi:molybdopterin converting factor small subunit
MKIRIRTFANIKEICGFDEKELKTDLGKGNFIFVGSSCDMWAQNIPEEWIEKLPDLEDFGFDDSINLPDISMSVLKKFKGSYLIGGGKTECLAEVKLLMDTLNINYTLVKNFIY